MRQYLRGYILKRFHCQAAVKGKEKEKDVSPDLMLNLQNLGGGGG